MNYQKTCEYCTASFEAVRSDAKYCTDRCRARASQQRKLEKDAHYKRELKYKALQNQIKQTKIELNNYINQKKELEIRIKSFEKTIANNKLILSFPQEKQKDIMLKYAFNQKGWKKGSYEYQQATNLYANMPLSQMQREFKEFNQEITELIKKQEKKLSILELEYYSLLDPKAKLQELEQELEELIESPVDVPILAKPLPVDKSFAERKRKQRRRKKTDIFENNHSNTDGMGGEDIQNMRFDTFTLSGELGRFLGDLDRNKLAFALTGESGSGKSYFSYELARLFLDDGFTVKYYSLEEGIGKLTQEKLSIYDIGNEMKLTGEGGLQDIKKAAKKFDVIIVDSFSKLTSNPKEFENLRSRHPKTIFIIIFQQTTAKTMKGGASIKYNSSATINLKFIEGERVAVMEKGRYGTQGWIYNIEQERIITEF